MHIFHIPTGFPSRHNAVSGISAKDLIDAFSKHYPETINIVSLFHETTFYLVLKGNNFLKELVRYFRKKDGIQIIWANKNLALCYAPKSLIYSNKLGYNVKEHWLKQHRENLKYIIKTQGKPDIIHGQFTHYGGWVAWMLSKEFSIPCIITERFGPFPPPGSIVNERLSDDFLIPMKEVAALVSVSQSHAIDIKKYVNRDIQVIHNLIDEELFIPKKKNMQEDGFQFATITSSYQPNKGIKDLLIAISIIKKRGINAQFLIGGGGTDHYYKGLKKLTKELDIEDRVQWVDKLTRREVASVMQKCNCFISSSIYESFGLVCTEAIACGIPVIATRSGGPEDIINITNGLLVDKNNPVMLAEAIEKMLNSIGNYNPEEIRQDFINRFSRKAIVEKYFQLYSNIINKK